MERSLVTSQLVQWRILMKEAKLSLLFGADVCNGSGVEKVLRKGKRCRKEKRKR
jgi:hypothetical protein